MTFNFDDNPDDDFDPFGDEGEHDGLSEEETEAALAADAETLRERERERQSRPDPCRDCTADEEFAGLDPCYGCRHGRNPEEDYERFLETGRGRFIDDEAEELAVYPHKAFDPQGADQGADL